MSYVITSDNFEAKAPFAYAVALFNLDLSSPSVATTAPTITLSFVHTEGGLIPSSVVIPVPSQLTTVLDYTRPIFTILLWLIFIGYLFFVPRRLFI